MVGCKPATQNAEEAIEVENVVVDDEQPEVYNVVEVDPEFPGGIDSLQFSGQFPAALCRILFLYGCENRSGKSRPVLADILRTVENTDNVPGL